MSFSKSFNGTAAIVLAAIAAFPAEQRKTDEGYKASSGVIEGHAKQIEAGAAMLTTVIEQLPDEQQVQATLNGHASDDGSGSYGFSLSVSGLQTPKTE